MSDGEHAAHVSATAVADAETRGADSATASDGAGAADDKVAQQEQGIGDAESSFGPGQKVSVISVGRVLHKDALVWKRNQETGKVTLLVPVSSPSSRKKTAEFRVCSTLLRPNSANADPPQTVTSEGNDSAVERVDCDAATYTCEFTPWLKLAQSRQRSGRNILAGSVGEADCLSPESLHWKINDLSLEETHSYRNLFNELEGRRNSMTEAEFNEQWRALNR